MERPSKFVISKADKADLATLVSSVLVIIRIRLLSGRQERPKKMSYVLRTQEFDIGPMHAQTNPTFPAQAWGDGQSQAVVFSGVGTLHSVQEYNQPKRPRVVRNVEVAQMIKKASRRMPFRV